MKIQFVLVEPKVPENIGASARAIKTMGFDSLVLVNPCEWIDGKSKWVAHGSAEILENARVFQTLEEALGDSDFSVATSARKRSVKEDYIQTGDLSGIIKAKGNTVSTVSVVFGREESGLTNEEMRLCDITSTIRMVDIYPSLNLSHAVMIYAYELGGLNTWQAGLAESRDGSSYKMMKKKVSEILLALGISEADSRYGRIMERISVLDDDDIHLVHSLCNSLKEKLG